MWSLSRVWCEFTAHSEVLWAEQAAETVLCFSERMTYLRWALAAGRLQVRGQPALHLQYVPGVWLQL